MYLTFCFYTDIYNPWSIASFIDSCGKYDTYWADTRRNRLVNSLIRQGDAVVKSAMEFDRVLTVLSVLC